MTNASPRARLLVVLALAVVLALLGASEILAAHDRAAPGEEMVDRDVDAARERVAADLSLMERSCADAAAAALTETADLSDQDALFTAIARVPLPDGAGLYLEDGTGRVIAWAGVTVDDAEFAAMPRSSDGPWFVETAAARRIAVRRTRASPRGNEGVPVLAVCHRPFFERSPLRNRAPAQRSIEADVEREFRVGDVRVLAPDAADGDPVKSASGGTLVRIAVSPLSARSWNEAVDAAARARRAAIVGALALVAAVALWREAAKIGAPPHPSRAAHVVRAAVVLAARAALGLLPPWGAADLGTLTDAARYSDTAPLDLAGTPASLVLTCAAACLAAACLRRAAHASPRGGGPVWRTMLAAGAAALACRLALGPLVHGVVVNSRVEYFSPETILPRAAPGALLFALLLAGVAAVFLVDAAWTLFEPRVRLTASRAFAASVVLAVVVAPAGPAGGHTDGLTAAAIVGFAAALASSILGTAVAVRAAAIPLGTAVALFAPLEREVGDAVRDTVEREAAARVSRTDAAERLVVAGTLDDLAQDPALLGALARGRVPRDLALNLWAESALSSRTGGSSIEIFPAAGIGERQRFSVDLPPDDWMPDLDAAVRPGEISGDPLAGRGSGSEGRWIVGETRVVVEGRTHARVRVVLETRAPAVALPELQVLSAARAPDLREAPVLAVTHYDADGKLTDSDDPYRPAGAPVLDAQMRRAAIGEAAPRWYAPRDLDRSLEVFVRPDAEDGVVTGVDAFSFDTGGVRTLLLRGTRAALCGALVSILALLATARSWARRARLRLAQRLIVSYVLVSALPLTVLGWANRQIAMERADETTERDLAAAITLLRAALHEDRLQERLTDLPPQPGPARDIRWVAYGIGHHANVFVGPRLVAASDQGLFDTELLPTRLPGPVYREVVLLGRPLKVVDAVVGDFRFDVGYAPLRSASEREVIGAVSVPLLHQRLLRDRELARAVTAVLGLYLASLLAAVAVGSLLARRLTRPLSDMTDAARRVARGDLEHPVPGAGPDELGEVVTAFNQMQHDLGDSRARLVKAEKEAAWRDMARQVAHEVKNPLTPMRLAAEHMRRAWRDKAPNFADVLERGVDLIVRQTETLQRIATAFSDFARFPNRRREMVDVAKLLDEALDLWQAADGVTLRREIARPLPELSADPDELRRVLVNLVKNAAEALEGRGGVITARLAQEGSALVLAIADDGPGIPEDVKPRLFEPYLSTKTKGTGLGLAICKRAVEDLGGTITITSRTGEGTTVTVRLPLAAPAPPAG